MSHENQQIELFVFPDGTRVEIIVFDRSTREHAGTPPAALPPRRDRTTPALPHGAAPQSTTPAEQAPSPCRVSPPPRETQVHTCPICDSHLVYPVDWDRSGPAAWRVTLRCPECETLREVTLDRAVVERFNRELYTGAQTLAREAERLTRRNFADEAERFVAALRRDLILPMDF